MKYYFEKDKELAYIKYDSLEEYERLLRIPYVHKNKSKDTFAVRLPYLTNLNQKFDLLPNSDKDKESLFKRVAKVRYLSSLENKKKHDGFDYDAYLNITKSFKGLYPFQKIGVEYIVKAKKCILADDVGLGKTIQAITALCRLIRRGDIKGSIIIVALASVKYQWLTAINDNVNLDKIPELRDVTVIEGTKSNRRKLYAKKSKVYILNYEQFIYDFADLVHLSRNVDAIVLDEASKVKNPKAQRTKKIKTLMNTIPIKILLTATPIENKLLDLFSLEDFLDKGIFVNYNFFKKKYCVFIQFRLGKFGPLLTKLSGYKNLKDAISKVKGTYLRRTAEMVGVQLPKFIVSLRLVDLFPEQRDLYDKVVANNKMELGEKRSILHQICSDPSQLDIAKIEKSAKIEELLYLMENELSNSKVIVFSFYRRFTNALYKRLKAYNPLYIHGGTSSRNREDYRLAFNNTEKHRVLIMTSAGEMGVDVPTASVVVNMDLPDNPSRLKQRCGRLRRLSSKHKNVRIINILARNTIEQNTVKNIFNKMKLFTAFFNEDTPNLVSDSK